MIRVICRFWACLNDLLSETDARGNRTEYTVDSETSRNEEVTDRCGNRTAYEYDTAGRTTKVTSKNPEGDEVANVSYSYDAFDNMTGIVRGDGMKYVLAYNGFRNLESIGIDGKAGKLIKYSYKNGSGRLKQITYANGDAMKATYNSVGQMVAEKWYNAANTLTAHYKYVYDGQGNIVRSLDILAGIEYNYAYENGRIVRAAESSIILSGEIVTAKNLVSSILYSYDSEGKLTKKRIIPVDGAEQVVYYETSDDNTVVKFSAGGRTVTSHSKTDSFGRKVFDELQLGTGFVSRQFHYHSGDVTDEHVANEKLKSSATTQLVSQIVLSGGRTISYEYDAEEHITKVTDSVDGITEYTYDALGQLLTEKKNGTVVNTMEYDNYGNILSKNGTVYTYGTSAWKDLLTGFGDQSISYDAQGNPTSYLGHTLTWEKGRQLKSFDNNTYTYNANGIRTSKTVNGVKHTYTLDGTKLLRETWGSNTLIPLYDNEDSVCGIIYNNEPFYLQKNLQGDIVAVIGKDARVVATYSYDAWGVCTVTSDTSAVCIATVNPFRYRGYYYDSEIGMYYLQSRYYDAGVGRFVNADTADSLDAVSKILESNLYAYCQNDPVNETDCSGCLIGKIIKSILVGVFKGFIGQLGSDLITFLYKLLLVDSNTKFEMSGEADYLKSILSAIASELIGFLGATKLAAQIFMIVGGYFTKFVNNKMKATDWILMATKLGMLILRHVLGKKLNSRKKKELDKLKKFRKKKSRNVKLKSQRKQIKLKIEKKGFKIDLTFDITEYVLENFFDILTSISST